MKNMQESGAITFAIDYYDKETTANMTQMIWNQPATDFRKLIVVEQENPGPMSCTTPVILYVEEGPVATTTVPVQTFSTIASQFSTTTSSVVSRVVSTTSSVAKQVNRTTTSLSR